MLYKVEGGSVYNKTLRVLTAVIGSLFLLLPSGTASAGTWQTGKTYLAANNSYVFTQKPSLAGSIPAGCTDVRIVISNDWTSGSDPTAHFYTYFETPHFSGNQVQLNTATGQWFLDLTPSGLNYSIPYGIYHVDVMSNCGNNTSQYTDYSNPKYADRYNDAMHVYPYACYDANDTTAIGNTHCRPLYRLYNPYGKDGAVGDHLLTTNDGEKRTVLGRGYNLEGIMGFVQDKSGADRVNVLRYFHHDSATHFYTSNYTEINTLQSCHEKLGIRCDFWRESYTNTEQAGFAFSAYPGTVPGTGAIYRVYNTRDGSHVLTSSQQEVATLEATGSYKNEGEVFAIISN